MGINIFIAIWSLSLLNVSSLPYYDTAAKDNRNTTLTSGHTVPPNAAAHSDAKDDVSPGSNAERDPTPITTVEPPVVENYQTPTKPEYKSTISTKDPNNIPEAQKLTADVFSLYDKWHGVIMEPESKSEDTSRKVLCDISIEHVHVTDNSVLSGNGKFYGENFTFQGTVETDGSLHLTFSYSVASKLSRCTFTNVEGNIYFDNDKNVWIYKGNITESDSLETFLLEPVGSSDSTTAFTTDNPKQDKINKDENSALVGLAVCGGLLFLALFGFFLSKFTN